VRPGNPAEVPSVRPPRNLPASPLPENLEGLITDAKDDLVEINLGSDHGLAVNHSLYVIRVKPNPLYLGEIRLVQVNANRAVGRVVVPRKDNPIQKNDLVVSRITGDVPGTRQPKEPPRDVPQPKP
jgi:hypothetical protein